MQMNRSETSEKKKLLVRVCSPLKRIPKTFFIIAFIIHVLEAGAPFSAFAVSFFPVPLYHRQERLETPMRTGETVYLFQSGTPDIKRGIHPNDVLIVHRIDSSCRAKEVGKIRVISFVGETYIKGEVIEGEVRADDIAKKGDVSCLVIFAGICDKER